MKEILKQSLILTVFASLLYACGYILTLWIYPPEQYIDTYKQRGAFFTQHGKILTQRILLRRDQPDVIILGASVTQEGIRPHILQKNFPRYHFHNLATQESNMTEIRQEVESVYEILPQNRQHQPVFILGLWYGSFRDNDVQWPMGETNLDVEKRRFYLYSQKDGRYALNVPIDAYPLYIQFLRPFISVHKNIYARKNILIDAILSLRKKKTGPDPVKDLAISVKNGELPFTEDKLARAKNLTSKQIIDLKKWKKYMGRDRLMDEQFEVFVEIARLIRENGGTLILVDMPVPTWHIEFSDLFNDYENKLKKFLPRILALSNTYFIDIHTALGDDKFKSVHPTTEAGPAWTEYLALKLKPVLLNDAE